MQPGVLVSELSKQLRVSPEKVRRWIENGELAAINTASTLCARPRYVVTQESINLFLQQRRTGAAPAKPPRSPRRKPGTTDYYPD